MAALAGTAVYAQTGTGAATSGSTGAGAGATTGTGTGTTGGLPGRTSGQVNPSTPNTSSQGANTLPRPIFISGKVMVDDGSPVPSNVVIQRVCGGNPHAVAYTDGKGRFSFQWGQNNAMTADASESGAGIRNPLSGGGFGSAQSAGGTNPFASDPFGNQMMNCEVRAQMAGFRSDSINLFSRNSMDNPEIGTIVLHRLANVEGTSISATSYLAPKDAKKAYDKGLQSLLKNKPAEAEKEFQKAVEIYPKYADAWMNLGKARLQQKSFEPAREALLKAIESDGKLVSPYVELGLMAAQQQKWADSGQYLDRAMRLDPVDFPEAWYVSAVANFNLKKYDAAEKSVREAGKLDQNHANPRIELLLGMVLIEKHEYDGAALQLRSFLKLAPNAPDATTVKDQLSQLDKFIQGQKAAGQAVPVSASPK